MRGQTEAKMRSHLAVMQKKRVLTGPSITLVQQKVGHVSNGNMTITFDTSPTVGNMIIVCLDHVDTDSVNVALDNAHPATPVETYSPVGVAGLANRLLFIYDWGGEDVTAVTFTAGVGLTPIVANVSEWSGLSPLTQEDQNSNSGVAGATVTTGSATPVSSGNLMIACGGWTANDYSSGPTNSFTRMTPDGTGAIWLEAAYKIQSSATAKSTGWTLTAGINWAAGIATFGAQ